VGVFLCFLYFIQNKTTQKERENVKEIESKQKGIELREKFKVEIFTLF
jgi:hypothetical protein